MWRNWFIKFDSQQLISRPYKFVELAKQTWTGRQQQPINKLNSGNRAKEYCLELSIIIKRQEDSEWL